MKLSELRKACEDATPGPWRTLENVPYVESVSAMCYVHLLRPPDTDEFMHDRHMADARFIAIARTALPALLEALDSAPVSVRMKMVRHLESAGIEVDE